MKKIYSVTNKKLNVNHYQHPVQYHCALFAARVEVMTQDQSSERPNNGHQGDFTSSADIINFVEQKRKPYKNVFSY